MRGTLWGRRVEKGRGHLGILNPRRLYSRAKERRGSGLMACCMQIAEHCWIIRASKMAGHG